VAAFGRYIEKFNVSLVKFLLERVDVFSVVGGIHIEYNQLSAASFEFTCRLIEKLSKIESRERKLMNFAGVDSFGGQKEG